MSPTLDGRVLAYAVAVSVVTGLVFGLVAAVPSVQLRLHSGALSAARGATGGGAQTRDTLVFFETASAVVLLAGATLLAASFARLMRVDPGFDANRVIAVRLGRLPASYDAERRVQLVDRLLERIRSVPGVEHAAAAPNLPLERGMNFPIDTREHPELATGAVELRFVSPDYLATLGVPLTGRDFDRSDVASSEPVAIVNQAFARRFWGSDSPIGRTIQIGHFKDRWVNPRLEHQTRVIGVAEDIRERGLDRPPRATVLVPRTQQSDDRTSVLLVRGTTSQLAAVLRREVLAEAPQLAPTIESLSAVVSRSVAGPRFRTMLFGTFAGSALLLAAIGIYGVIAAMVEQRRRELGIRLSLGATRAGVALGVVRRCLVSVSAGTVVGLFTFWLLRRSLTSMLFDTSASDPRMLAIAVMVLALVATLAAWIPARRAARVDPAITLRLD
jgi:predicted permease